MSVKKFLTLQKVVETGSLTKAAEELDCTQSAVSYVISSLEEELGIPLLERSRQGVRLTDAGERIMPAVRGLLSSYEQICQITASLRGMDSGTVRIGTFTSVAVHWLPGIIKDFQEKYPNVSFALNNGDYYDVEQWLAEGSIDLGFVALPSDISAECIPLAEDRLMAVLPKDHPLAGASVFPVTEAKGQPFISLLESSDSDARRALQAAGVRPDVKFTTKDDYAIIAMVENGLGISILPELLLEGHRENVSVLPLSPPSKRVIALAFSDKQKAGPATQSFANHILSWVESHRSSLRSQI